MAKFTAEVINTLHFVPTGKFKLDKKTGRMKEIKQRVIHRRLFLTAIGSVIGASNLRIVRVKRGDTVTYSLAERKETERPWWEKKPPTVAKDYTRVISRATGRPEPAYKASELIKWLTYALGSAEAARAIFDELETGEPLEGDARWQALAKYGYEQAEYEEVSLAA